MFSTNMCTGSEINPFILASHKRTPANSVDPDQMQRNVASDQGIYCLL